MELFAGRPPEPTEEQIAKIRFCSYASDGPDAGVLLGKFQALPLAERQRLLDWAEACRLDVLTQVLLERGQKAAGEPPSSMAEQAETSAR